jgi:hypothetical protein
VRFWSFQQRHKSDELKDAVDPQFAVVMHPKGPNTTDHKAVGVSSIIESGEKFMYKHARIRDSCTWYCLTLCGNNRIIRIYQIATFFSLRGVFLFPEASSLPYLYPQSLAG